MKAFLWIIAIVACMVAFSWPKLAAPALAVALVCGLVGLVCLRRSRLMTRDENPRDEGSLPQPPRRPDVEFRDRGERFGPS